MKDNACITTNKDLTFLLDYGSIEQNHRLAEYDMRGVLKDLFI